MPQAQYLPVVFLLHLRLQGNSRKHRDDMHTVRQEGPSGMRIAQAGTAC